MKTIYLSFLALLLIFQTGCDKEDEATDSLLKSKKISDYEIALNGELQINLASNPTTGYSWEWTNEDQVQILQKADWSYSSDPSGLEGAGGQEKWTFKGVKEGTGTIRLEYRRHWDPGSTIQVKTFRVNVF